MNILESNEVPPPEGFSKETKNKKNYEHCLIEWIKCHHNDITDYIENNLMDQTENEDLQQNEEIISICIKYHNFSHFKNASIIDHGFFYLSCYHYDKLFELLLKKKEKSIKNKMIQYSDIRTASEKNEIEVIYCFLLQIREISVGLFKGTKIKQITIPLNVSSIGDYAFERCSSLTQIAIPSSVTSIGNYAFSFCTSLTQIIIPSSVTSIRDYTFNFCTSLTQIIIPSSVTSIGDSAFYLCTSLTQITIPSSVTSIGYYAFYGCSSLTQITILSSVISIDNSSFSGCSSLTQITITSPLILDENHLNSNVRIIHI